MELRLAMGNNLAIIEGEESLKLWEQHEQRKREAVSLWKTEVYRATMARRQGKEGDSHV